MTQEYHNVTGQIIEADDYYWPPDDADEDDPAICYNCGSYGHLIDDGLYRCSNCGDEWDIYYDPLEDWWENRT